MTASSEYGVAVAENFQPPENWVPGQEINKDAGAVNTGNVDAFVRTWLNGKMRLLNQNTTGSTTKIANYTDTSAGSATSAFGSSGVPTTSATTDQSLISAGLTLMDATGNYYKTLSTTQAANPALTLSTSHAGFTGTTSTALSEVQAMQSGILAYAPTDAEYTYILNEPTTLTIKVKSVDGTATTVGTNDYQTVEVPAGTLVHVGGTAGEGVTYASGAMTIPTASYTDIMGNTSATQVSTVYVKTQTHNDTSTYFAPVDVEYETFVPLTDGLYLFLRNEEDANQANPEFSGYYKKTQDIVNAETNTTENNQTVYYALNTDTARANRSDYTVKGVETTATYAAPIAVTYDGADKNILHVVPSDNLELFTAQYSNVTDSDLKWYYDNTDDAERIIVLYDKNNDGDFDEDTDVAVIISLDNVKDTSNTGAETWTAIGATTSATPTGITGVSGTYDASKLTFYYNNDLEAGDTTAKLVDNVKLYQGVTNKAYLAFDFDLNVALESVQVTFGEDGTEAATALSEWTSDNGNWTGATGSATMGTGDAAKEIASVSWS